MIKQEILSKLANKEDLTQEEIELMLQEFKEVQSDIIDTGHWDTTISAILEVDEDLYYEITSCVPNNAEDFEYQQPRRVKKETEPVESFVRCED
ncbi:hypothetical protein [Snodgrassella alvi]|uniref:hypothetical protein n=1 Tax=Snodgrassella alvi TaxID=1196083 RepID=UPI000C1E41DE|nr:hypothetical protein [Snodgrassella alvi]PIT63915.1 hypothetical protein BHC52_10585 [Snodgrassella alvi]